jgi:hypothetical protein
MLQALRHRLFGGRHAADSTDAAQLALAFEGPPRDASELLGCLRARGLARIAQCELTTNRHVMVSFRGNALRVHRGYLGAPEPVLRAIVRFVEGRTKAERRQARKVIVSHRIAVPDGERRQRRERTHPDDEPMVLRLRAAHAQLNAERFGGALSTIPVRVSRRMKSRLGHYAPALNGALAEIAISRRHIRRHAWDAVLETLVHEMVHQWQGETGRTVDHGAEFKRKAREVGAAPRATLLILHHA